MTEAMPDQPDLLAEVEPKPDIDMLLAEIDRELLHRHNLYPGWVARGSMTQEKADRQIMLMEHVRHKLVGIKALRMALAVRPLDASGLDNISNLTRRLVGEEL